MKRIATIILLFIPLFLYGQGMNVMHTTNRTRVVAESGSTLLEGIQGYWAFEDASGNLTDGIASVDGTASGSPTYSQTGIINNAITFGAGSYFNMGEGHYQYTTFTVAIWVNTSTTNYQCPVSNWDSDNSPFDGWMFYSEGNTYTYTYISDGSGHNLVVNGDIAIYDGDWHLLVLIYDGSDCYLYVDNVQDGTSGWSYDPAYSTASFQIGARAGGASFTGTLDECGIWNRVLTSDELSELYNSGNGLTYPF